ncbi:unnamed protein product [Urochloa humidicola]
MPPPRAAGDDPRDGSMHHSRSGTRGYARRSSRMLFCLLLCWAWRMPKPSASFGVMESPRLHYTEAPNFGRSLEISKEMKRNF